jgi:hypothetical protein
MMLYRRLTASSPPPSASAPVRRLTRRGTIIMSRILRRVATFVSVAAGAAALLAPATYAAEPTFLHISDSFTEVDDETCGFPITLEVTFTADVQFFYNNSGDLVRSLNHIQIRGTDSANGVTLADNADFTHTFDFTTQTNGDLGVTTRVLLPHGGTVLFDAGRVLSDEEGNSIFVAGTHQVLNGDFSAYCAALSG